MEEKYLDILIQKYLNNTATAEEIRALHDWYRSVNDESHVLPYITLEEEQHAKQKMLLKLQKQITANKPADKKVRAFYKYAAVAAVLIIGVFLGIRLEYSNRQFNEAEKTTIVTGFGQRKIIHLNDGSTVWLSAGSKITYPVAFKGKLREVNFLGEAYFDIAKDKAHPFIIHTLNTTTKVLGTSFNVKAFPKQLTVEVALVEGKVSFKGQKSEVILLPHEQVVYNKTAGTLTKSKFSDANDVVARREGEYKFDNMRVNEIAEELTRNFNVNITVEGEVKNCTFFGRLKKGETVDRFLNKMGLIVNASVSKSGNGYLIKGGGCK
ncbi:FecR family protein [Mucilaginibacter terrae]|uniref:Transmembrane sensor n=1 Tax=Mucilaginibacter terrae TaxID=1955052 RepID=A0ABU3GZV9_9SPHI|nr:FecR domain-containing protein [Mucilaginibacter terrae]MDT3405304.1 transmembrane sensor [Mucilaginibacter terrae]